MMTAAAAVLISYVTVWVGVYLVVHHANEGSETQNSTDAPSIMLVVEAVKLIFSSLLFCRTRDISDLIRFFKSGRSALFKILVGYVPVAVLYAAYNNLMLVNLKTHHPTIYLIFSSSRLLMVAYAWQMLFNVRIPSVRKIALVLITLGIFAKGFQSAADNHSNGESTDDGMIFRSTLLIIIQMACSVMASVYNEKLLKQNPCNQHLQNICLCINSIVVNSIIFIFMNINDGSSVTKKAVFSLASIKIVIALACAGIISSMVLRFVDSVTKGVASASETVLTCIIDVLFFDYTLTLMEAVSVCLVTAGTTIYSLKQTLPKKRSDRSDYGNATVLECLVERCKDSRERRVLLGKRLVSLAISVGTLMYSLSLAYVLQHQSNKFVVSDLQLLPYSLNSSYNPQVLLERHIAANSTISVCTKKVSRHESKNYQINLRRHVKENANKQKAVQEVLHFIIERLSQVGAPAALMYGTLLHEFRNGTGPCVIPRADDKDFDIAVFERHFHMIVDMQEEIKSRFGFWTGGSMIKKGRLMMVLLPPDQKKVGTGFQIDIYGFRCDDANGLIYFPWDEVAVQMKHFLPLVKHKTLPIDSNSEDVLEPLYHHIPFNPQCLLPNMYGHDFMTPKRGHFIQQNAFSHSEYAGCKKEMNLFEKKEFIRQRSLCQSKPENIFKQRPDLFMTDDKNKGIHMQESNSNIQDEISPKSEKNIMIDDHNNLRSGIITCVEKREDAVHVLVLAESVHAINVEKIKLALADSLNKDLNAQGKISFDTIRLEIYHTSKLSQFLTAKLESFFGVTVVNLQHQDSQQQSCYMNAVSMSTLHTMFLTKPSIALLSQEETNKEKGSSFSRYSSSSNNKCNGSRGLTKNVVSTMDDLDKVMEAFMDVQDTPCQYQHIHSNANHKHEIYLQSFPSQKNTTNTHHYEYMPNIIVGDESSGNKNTVMLSFLHLHTNGEWFWSYPYKEELRLNCAGSQELICNEISKTLNHNAYLYTEAFKLLLLDRPLNWVAFDGGLVSQSLQREQKKQDLIVPCSRFNSLEGSKASVNAAHSVGQDVMINMDLVSTADHMNIAMHDTRSFGPYDFKGNQLTSQYSISHMKLDEVSSKRFHNPCVPEYVIRTWLDPNRYRHYKGCDETCVDEPIANLTDIVKELASLTEVVFDLKSSTSSYDQGRDILKIMNIYDNKQNEAANKMSVRYFSTNKKGPTEVVPEYILKQIEAGRFPMDLKIYINVPSKEVCLQMATWSKQMNVRLAGCFVQINNGDVERSWEHISKSTSFATMNSISVPSNDLKIICDVPIKQKARSPAMWRAGIVSCVEKGYDWIHFPLAPSKADFAVPLSSTVGTILPGASEVEYVLSKAKLFYADVKKAGLGVISLQTMFDSYVSLWGITSPFHWKPEQQQWSFAGQNMNTKNDKLGIYRCITKILTVMLFLRLEEIGLLNVDDRVPGLGNDVDVTWRQIFTNTAGVDGSEAGKRFVYSNSLWFHVANPVVKATKMSFLDAMEFYILQPLGLRGNFDIHTEYPPFMARGFLGTNEDMMVIGSTLVSGGISPKTRLRVLSQTSVDKMLKDWTSIQNVKASFLKDSTVKSMKRFQDGNSDFRFDVVDGYGMGLWRVNGWRMRKDGEGKTKPIRGWLSMGSSEALLYFDEDMIIVTMLSQQRVKGLEMTSPFANLIKAIDVL